MTDPTFDEFMAAPTRSRNRGAREFIEALAEGVPVAVPADLAGRYSNILASLRSVATQIHGAGRVQFRDIDGALWACLVPEAKK